MTDRERRSTSAQSRGDRTPIVALIFLFLGSLALRVIYLAQIRKNPTFLHPTADPLTYHERALEILGGDFLGHGVSFHSSPLYPYFLAVNYLINGQSLFWTYVAQAIIGSLTALLLWILADRLFDRTVAWCTGLLAATYQGFIFFTGELLEITLVLGCVVASLLLLEIARRPEAGVHDEIDSRRPRVGYRMARLFAAGMLLGLATLGKPNILATVPFVILGLKLRDGLPWSQALRPAAVILVGAAIAVLPVTLRNIVAGKDLVLTSSNGGINFYIGNNENAAGIFKVDPSMEADLGPSSERIAERATGRDLKPSEVSSYWFRRGLDFVRDQPGQELKLLARKFLLIWNGYEIPNYFDLSFFTRYSGLLRWTPSRFGTVIPLALLGLAFAWPERRRLSLFYLFVASYLATILVFFVTSRYRLPAVPFLLVFAAYAFVALLRSVPVLRDRLAPAASSVLGQAAPASVATPTWKRSTLLLAAGGLLLATAFVHIPLYHPEQFYAHQHGAIASVYKQEGRFEEAAREYEEAVKLGPRGVLFRNNLGVCLLALHRDEEAETMIQSALELDPDYPPALRNLGRIYESRGDTLRALAAYKMSFDADVSETDAGVDLGRLLAQRGELGKSRDAFERVLQTDPNNVHALWNLSVLLGTKLERPKEAHAYLERLLALQPDHSGAIRLRTYLLTGS